MHYGALMKHLLVVLFVAVLGSTLAQSDVEPRVAELEERVAALEARLDVPEPPPTTESVGEFAFTRLDARTSSIGLEVVGEVTAENEYESVEFRVTFYAEDGSILETSTFYVEEVSTMPRTFSTDLFSDYSMSDVDSYRIEVVSAR